MTSFETLNREYSLINELPQHKKVNIDMNIFTINFKQKLKKEMKKYIADKKVQEYYYQVGLTAGQLPDY